MRRRQLFEFHDQPWFPDSWRQLLTELIALFTKIIDPFRPLVGRLAAGLRTTGGSVILDLCSGASGPLRRLAGRLEAELGRPVNVILSDKYPHLEAFRSAAAAGGGRISYRPEPVDALAVPRDLRGFRTLFTSFHHFSPPLARAILADAVAAGEGIAVCEYTEPSFMWVINLLASPLLIWLLAPFCLRPFTWRKLLWIYLLPVPLAITVWDGLVSTLRTYSPAELEGLVAGIDGGDYSWEIGRMRSTLGCRVTWLIGVPVAPKADGSPPRVSP